jgi:hypothetical protein
MTPKTTVFVILSCMIWITGCNKKADGTPTPPSPQKFENLTFNTKNAYFAADGSMSTPVDSVKAKTMSNKIMFTFFYNFDYDEPGFLEPVTRSKEWYWNENYKPWLKNAVETKLYTTKLTAAQFDEAKGDQRKIAEFFSDTNIVNLAPHAVYLSGGCIGGRQTSSPESATLAKKKVFAFKCSVSKKKGLFFIRSDQASGWPMAITSTDTKVDIIIEK